MPIKLAISAGALFLLLGMTAAAYAQHEQQVKEQGIFGFSRGMTKEQVINLIGRQAVVKDPSDGSLRLNSAPMPHPDFTTYILNFSPQEGLLRIVAITPPVETSRLGTELKSKLQEIERGISSSKYDEPHKTLDYLHTGSIWNQPQEWMMALLKHERTLGSDWQLSSPSDNKVTRVLVGAVAFSVEKGCVVVVFEFDGWNTYKAC